MESNTTTTTSDTTSMSSQLSVFIVDQLKRHGLPFAMMGIAVWYFLGENKEIKTRINDCNSTLTEIYRTDRLRMESIIINNTAALHELQISNNK